MRLYQKLVLFMLVASVGPVAAVGFALLGHAERELRARIVAGQAGAAAAAAELAARDVDEAVESLTRTAASIRWAELGPEERQGALRLLVRQSASFTAATLVDAEGVALAPVAAVADVDLAPLTAALPVAELRGAEAGTVAMSGAFARPRASAAALAVRVAGEPWIAAVELGLAALQERAERATKAGAGELWIYDGAGRAVAAPTPERIGASAPAGVPAAQLGVGAPASWTLSVDGTATLASAARLPGQLGWYALVAVPEAVALAPVARMRAAVLGSVGAALALLLGLGFAFTRSLGGRIGRIAAGAQAFARGELASRVPESGADELAELGRTFNAMGAELEGARRRLETWNEELQRRVEERTAELKAAQAQLLEAQKLAAIGQLGAGVAHEINNPLAGILGNAQLLLLDRPEGDREAAVLRKIEAQAKRAKEITANLLRFSQQRPQADLKPLDLNRVAAESLSLVETQIHAEGIELALALDPAGPKVRGDAGHLAQVLLNLVSNARTAMLKSPQKRLAVSTEVREDKVLLRVADTGKGIAAAHLPRIFEPFFTTKDVWSNVGLGLSVSFRIVSEHGGRIEVASEEGKGSTFTVELARA